MMGDRIKELREDKGYTQTELANILQVSRQSLSNYENEIVEPNINTLIKMADFFNCSLDYLTGRTKEKYNLNIFDKETRELLVRLIDVVVDFKVKKK